MPFYVPVGKRGAILRVGMVLTRVLGACMYWIAWNRRRRAILVPIEAEF